MTVEAVPAATGPAWIAALSRRHRRQPPAGVRLGLTARPAARRTATPHAPRRTSWWPARPGRHALGRWARRPHPAGSFVWFTPGTIHRLLNDGGDLEIVVLMQNAGLPEAGDMVITFDDAVLPTPRPTEAAALPEATTASDPDPAWAWRDRGSRVRRPPGAGPGALGRFHERRLLVRPTSARGGRPGEPARWPPRRPRAPSSMRSRRAAEPTSLGRRPRSHRRPTSAAGAVAGRSGPTFRPVNPPSTKRRTLMLPPHGTQGRVPRPPRIGPRCSRRARRAAEDRQGVRRAHHPCGKVLVEQGDTGRECYVLVSGTAAWRTARWRRSARATASAALAARPRAPHRDGRDRDGRRSARARVAPVRRCAGRGAEHGPQAHGRLASRVKASARRLRLSLTATVSVLTRDGE